MVIEKCPNCGQDKKESFLSVTPTFILEGETVYKSSNTSRICTECDYIYNI